jgi:hypothetical protein
VLEFSIDVSYSQIAVFDSQLEDPFNDWLESHVKQGFSWRKGSVSFRTIEENGQISVVVRVAEKLPQVAGIRAIAVPFTCLSGTVDISSISSNRTVDLPKGNYQLLFEIGKEGNGIWCRFTFIPDGPQQPVILLYDSSFPSSENLNMNASPA